jgi:hypothetical protein
VSTTTIMDKEDNRLATGFVGRATDDNDGSDET